MKQRHHTPEQVIRKLAEGEKLLGEGQTIEEVARHRDHRVDLTPLAQPVRRDEGDDAKKLKELDLRTCASS